MITDIRTVPVESRLEADVCIIGGGAAGIAIARALIPSGFDVLLLESGGLNADEITQDLYTGAIVGEKYHSELNTCRSRYLGGSTNCWGAIFTPLDPIDFEKRPWVPLSGWPITYEQFHPWLRRAHEEFGGGPFLYDDAAWPAARIPSADFDRRKFEQIVWHFNSRRDTVSFGKRFRQELQSSSNVRVLLNANTTELVTDESGRTVERVRIATLEAGQGDRFVRAKIFILACGGIENPRLLLTSNRVWKQGIGNDRDLVGRYFQDHLQMPVGFLVGDNGRPAGARYSHLFKLGNTFCQPGLALTRAAQIENMALNGALSIDPDCAHEEALIALQKLRAGLKSKKFDSEMFRQIWKVFRSGGRLAPEAWRRLRGDRPQGDPNRYVVLIRAEQAPNRDSRVMLTDEFDALGMRRVSLEWRTNELDRRAVRLLSQFAASEFSRLGMGRYVENPWPEDGIWPDGMYQGPHHMGTTRMSDDPSTGVVDHNCKVHGLDGLYIAGSSVFPTGGHANPTFSILAFALRLASHVHETLGKHSMRHASFSGSVRTKTETAAALSAIAQRRIEPEARSLRPAPSN